MGATCGVCNHPRRADIDQARRDGWSQRRIGKAFDVGKDTVGRHYHMNHPTVPPDLRRAMGTSSVTPPPPPDADESPDPGRSPLDILRASRDSLEAKVTQGTARTDEYRELRQTIEAIGKLEGTDVQKTASVEDVRGLPELLAAWAVALEPFPEARKAMEAATRRVAPQLLEAAPDAS